VTALERFWGKVNKNGPLPSSEAVVAHPEITGLRCWLWTASTRNGYGVFGESHTLSVAAHRKAWHIAHGTWPTPFCLHKCDVRGCCRTEHLMEGSQKQNIQDMLSKGRGGYKAPMTRGEGHGPSKLTDKKVLQIHSLIAQGKSQTATALRFGVSQSSISHIVSGKTWSHVV
jgi:hypothetical protein